MMKRFSNRFAAAVLLMTATQASFGAADGIFPATTDAAKAAISWKDGFFTINGKPTFLAAGEIHYARVPRELWRDRILRTKAMGFNLIQTYVMWNAHEGREGVFSFEDNLDLDAWLKLCQELGMYTIVRPGPYVCAEWENGGLPAWLTAKPGMAVRTDHAEYLKYVDRFEAKIYAIIAKHQIHKGGTMLMVQLENELPRAWGTDENAYTRHLYQQARAAGLEVPLFNSGLHHGNDPAGNTPFGNRTLPWYSTEFWTGWIGKYGDMDPAMFLQKTRGTWKIVAFGGGGYDYYVVHGGTNFGYSKGHEVTASYDYASPIGEAGQLRNAYYPMKRAGMFTQTFNDLLTTSKDGDPTLVTTTTPAIKIYTRTSPHGTIAFVDNPGRTAVDAQVSIVGREPAPSKMTVQLAPSEIRPIVLNYSVTPDVKILHSTASILTIKKLGTKTFVVCHGLAGEKAEISTLGREASASIEQNAEPRRESVAYSRFEFPKGSAIIEFSVGNDVTLLVMNTEFAERTWIHKDSLVIGPQYVYEDGAMDFPGKGGRAVIYSAAGKKEINAPLNDVRTPPPALTNWQARAVAEVHPEFDDSAWAASPEPKPMETYDSYPNGYGWYRTSFTRDTAGDVQLRLSGAGDVIRVYLNGVRVNNTKTTATLAAKQGKNTLAILAFNEGRPKMYNFSGPTGMMNARGVWGPVMLSTAAPAITISQWKFQNSGAAADNAPAAAEFNDAAWPQIQLSANPMGRVGFAWFRTSFNLDKVETALLLHQGFDDEADVFLNGQPLGKHTGFDSGGTFDLSKHAKVGANVLAIRVRNTSGGGGITKPLEIVTGKPTELSWKFQGGFSGLKETDLIATVTNWQEWLGKTFSTAAPASAAPAGTPTFYSVQFSRDNFQKAGGLTEPLALRTRGLKAGSVWLNGHNLGPYKGEVPMYLPECWLTKTVLGETTTPNTLVIVDLEGASPKDAILEPMESWVRMPAP